jgi:hypothetical protein
MGSWQLPFPRIAPLRISRFSLPPKVAYFSHGQQVRALFEDTVRLRSIAWTLFICVPLAIPARSQSSRPPTRMEPAPGADDADDAQQRLARDLAKKANAERQAILKADTDKLLKLAVELKDSVDKSNENVLSLEVVKKAEEIEKLAHSVKDKMKGPS